MKFLWLVGKQHYCSLPLNWKLTKHRRDQTCYSHLVTVRRVCEAFEMYGWEAATHLEDNDSTDCDLLVAHREAFFFAPVLLLSLSISTI